MITSKASASLNINSHTLSLFNAGARKVQFQSEAGSEDSINLVAELLRESVAISLEREDVERLQYALVNFLNTGYFDVEG